MVLCLLILSYLVVEIIATSVCDSTVHSVQEITPAQSLLQAHQGVSKGKLALGSNISKAQMSSQQYDSGKVNPSGAAAPLSNVGYFAVADRNCQGEMRQFIERQLINLNYQVCDESGLFGIVIHHSRPLLQTFDKLTADILRDASERCTWLANSNEECQPRPDDCEEFTGLIPADCGCRRSEAAKLDFTSSTVEYNNLGGVGPNTGDPEEVRISGGGQTSSGVPFDLVVTTVGAYTAQNPANTDIKGGFFKINIKCDTSATFKFSFVVPGTNTPVTVSEVHMAMFDLDGSTDAWAGIESAASSGYHGYVTDANPAVTATLDNSTGVTRTQFQAPGNGDIGNPTDPQSLTDLQRRNSVMYFYTDVTEFEIDFIVAGGDLGRNLFFAFESALDNRCGP